MKMRGRVTGSRRSERASGARGAMNSKRGKLTAGVATLGLMGLAVAGSASAGSTAITDSIQLSIDTVCNFSTTEGENGASADDLTFTGTAINGNSVAFNRDGIHRFNVSCNHVTGYTVKAYATNLSREEGTGSVSFIPNLTTYNNSISNAPGTSVWTAQVTGGDEDAKLNMDEDNPATIRSTNTVSALTGDNFSVQYSAYIGTSTVSGTYKGQAVYTLTTNALPHLFASSFQTFGAEDIAEMAVGDTLILEDSRGDHKKYLVGKLADGKVYMLQNLALEPDTEIDDEDSNLAPNTSYKIPGVTGNFANKDVADAKFTGGDYVSPEGGNEVAAAASYGAYYNYQAVTAGTGSSVTSSLGEIRYNICPKGWTLPSAEELENLVTDSSYELTFDKRIATDNYTRATNYSTTGKFAAAWRPAYAGNYYSGSLSYASTNGYWWSRSSYSGTAAYNLYLSTSGYLDVRNLNLRYNGFSVRCVAAP